MYILQTLGRLYLFFSVLIFLGIWWITNNRKHIRKKAIIIFIVVISIPPLFIISVSGIIPTPKNIYYRMEPQKKVPRAIEQLADQYLIQQIWQEEFRNNYRIN